MNKFRSHNFINYNYKFAKILFTKLSVQLSVLRQIFKSPLNTIVKTYFSQKTNIKIQQLQIHLISQPVPHINF